MGSGSIDSWGIAGELRRDMGWSFRFSRGSVDGPNVSRSKIVDINADDDDLLLSMAERQAAPLYLLQHEY